MSRQVRRLSLVFALLMVAVLVNITLIQVVNAGDYRDRPGNQRILLAEYDRERGPILVGTDPVARSVETGNTLTYYGSTPTPGCMRQSPASTRSSTERPGWSALKIGS